ncbi:UNVERIFIED_CONTAM: hypothetical protein PYX00_001370 [Menopon gallinae]|uniref:Major facilitator superfamily associated domain-containing protein n=1 Tax=Menopon gallinae TaxID=328185 RepID=A0AAW2ICL9_9NEOP
MKMWPKVNKELLPMKGHYFLNSAGVASVQPFMPLYVNYLGFSSVVVGTLYLVQSTTGMLAKPFFGAIADRFRLHKFMFIFFQIVTLVAFFSIQFIPKVPVKNKEVTLVCESQTNFHVDISNIYDKCVIERVIADSDPEDMVKCKLKCELTDEFRGEVCHHWKRPLAKCRNSSASSGVTNYITENANFSKKLKGIDGGKDAYVEKYKASVVDDKTLELDATVAMKHTVQVADKLYFRVSKVLLENDTVQEIPYCYQGVDMNCNIECEDSRLAELLSDDSGSGIKDVVNLYQFWLLLLFLILSWVGMAVVGSITDAICFEMLGTRASQYGKQRLWGSVGWGLTALLTGIIIDEFSKGQVDKTYTPIFYIMFLLLLCDIGCMHSLKYQQTKLSSQILKNVGKLLKNAKVVVFLIWCIFIGICIGIQWNFLFWYVEKLADGGSCEMKARIKTLQGLMSGIQCFLGELPSIFLSGWLLRKFGHINVMSGILLVIGVRFTLYSLLTNPWWCLPIEILQGSAGLSFATMASYASVVAPPGTEATVQGFVGAIFEGIGVSMGSFLGGLFFEKYGGAICFRIFGTMAFVVFILHVATQYLLGRSSGFKLDGKDFNGIAKYASPNEAVSMLEDT